jgi:single-stranded DNA-binding protein
MLKTFAIGHLGADPRTRETKDGKQAIDFPLAVKYGKDTTQWLDCSWYAPPEALLPYLKKGSMVCAEGIPEPYHYQDKEGNTVAKLRLKVLQLKLLVSGGEKKDGTDLPF